MVTIYADGASLSQMESYADDPCIEGFTTNPSLMRKAGIKNYRDFKTAVLAAVKGKPVSFEVLADDFPTMEKQALEIASWGQNVYVKIPITNTKGKSSVPLIRKLRGLPLNITAVMTEEQIYSLYEVGEKHHIVSVFAGRIADTGRDPGETVAAATVLFARVLWASAREVFNVQQAESAGADIITLTPDLIAKLSLFSKDLTKYSLETVKQFHSDGKGIEL